MENLGYSINAVNMAARKLQALGADCKDLKAMYEVATNLTVESQRIRELIQERNSTWIGNRKPIGWTEIGNTSQLQRPTFLKRLLEFVKK